MANDMQNAVTTPPETLDPIDALTNAIADAGGIGDVRLFRLVGSLRQTVATMPADAWDPFTTGARHGPGRYMAQFIQRGKVLRSATFLAEDQQEKTAAAPQQPAPETGLMRDMLLGMMQQQTAMIQAMAQRGSSGGEASILEKILPAILQRETPASLYKQLLEMVERRETPAAAAPEAFDWSQLLKALPAILPAMAQQAAPQQPAPQLPAPQQPAPPPPPAPSPPTPVAVGSDLADLEAKTGLPLTRIPEVLDLAIRCGLDAAWSAETILEIVEAGPHAEAVIPHLASTPAEALAGSLLHILPQYASQEAYIRAVAAAIGEGARESQEQAGDVPGQLHLAAAAPVEPPPPTPAKKTGPKPKGPFKKETAP